jgi:hypothetical protein
MTETPVSNVGDEAMITHTPPQVGINSIVFRKGAALVKVGVHPAPSDAVLTAAAKTMAGRL